VSDKDAVKVMLCPFAQSEAKFVFWRNYKVLATIAGLVLCAGDALAGAVVNAILAMPDVCCCNENACGILKPAYSRLIT